MYRLKQAHVHVPHFRKKGPIDVPGSLILRPMFAAHPYNHFCTEYPPGEKWAPFPAKMTPNNGYEPGGVLDFGLDGGVPPGPRDPNPCLE